MNKYWADHCYYYWYDHIFIKRRCPLALINQSSHLRRPSNIYQSVQWAACRNGDWWGRGPLWPSGPTWTLKDLGEPSSWPLIGWRAASIVQLKITRAQWMLIPPTLNFDPSQFDSCPYKGALIGRVGFHIIHSHHHVQYVLPDKSQSLSLAQIPCFWMTLVNMLFFLNVV